MGIAGRGEGKEEARREHDVAKEVCQCVIPISDVWSLCECVCVGVGSNKVLRRARPSFQLTVVPLTCVGRLKIGVPTG